MKREFTLTSTVSRASKVPERFGNQDDRMRGLEVLREAEVHYNNMERFRQDRERNKRYNYGDQWSDPICFQGQDMTEEEYIMRQGNVPLKNNLIRRLVRNVVGVFRNQNTEPMCIARDREEQELGEVMTTALQYNMTLNRMSELYARGMEEFLISGLVVHRKWYGYRQGRYDCWTDAVQPNNFFLDSNMRDARGWDCNCVGEIHDVDFETLSSQFCHSGAETEELRQIYGAGNADRSLRAWRDFGFDTERSLDLLTCPTPGLCRVIEVWRKETRGRYRCHDWSTGEVFKVDDLDYPVMVESENARRIAAAALEGYEVSEVALIDAEWFTDSFWYYYFITPWGHILKEGETPYAHGGHPYVFKAYPFIDGEIHSFVNDVIDQQRYANRLVTLYDWILRASAKGVLMVPKDVIPKGMTPEKFAAKWTEFNGVIVYEPSKSHNHMPQQISSNSTNIGMSELLQLQLKFFEDVSGVHGALQGKAPYAGMSAALYSQQTQNATTGLLDILETYNNFMTEAAFKDVKNIQQFYDDKRLLNVVGRKAIVEYDPEKMRDVDYDLSIVQSQATPVYRSIANEFLMQIWQTGQITLEQMLEAGNFPFADTLLQSVRTMREQQEQQGAAQQALAAGEQQPAAPDASMQQPQ